MVFDGGGQFIPAGIDGFHTSLLLASLTAHARATEDIHRHIGKEHKRTRDTCTLTQETHATWVHYIILDREVLTPSPCE